MQTRVALEARIGAARHKFFDQRVAPADLVSQPILRSWSRCMTSGLGEHDRLTFDPVGRARISECRDRQAELRRLAEPAALRLATAVVPARHMVILTDADGVAVSVYGDGSRVSRTLQMLARPGVDLSERAIGTNSMGTALRERMAVAVTGAEHYCRTNARFVCMAAPLFLPDGRIAGTIDVTGDYDQSAPPLAAPVLGTARAIEVGLFIATQRGRLLLQFAWDTSDLGTRDAGWLAFDDDGRLTGATSAGRELLGLGDGTIHADFEALFEAPFHGAQRAAGRDVRIQLRTRHGFVFAARVATDAPLPPAAVPTEAFAPTAPRTSAAPAGTAASPVTLRQLTSWHVRDALAHEGGNKLRAARRLGIGRSTLYRLLASPDA